MPIKEQYQLTRFLRADFFFFFSASDRTLSRSARTLTADSIVTAMFRFSQQKATLYPRLRVGYEGAIHHHSRCMCTLMIGDSDATPPARCHCKARQQAGMPHVNSVNNVAYHMSTMWHATCPPSFVDLESAGPASHARTESPSQWHFKH